MSKDRAQVISHIKSLDKFFEKVDFSLYSIEELREIIKNLDGDTQAREGGSHK